MSQPAPDRNALLGLLAVRSELLSPEAFAETVRPWEREPGEPLGPFLVARGLLQAAELAHLEALVEDCLKRQGHRTQVGDTVPPASLPSVAEEQRADSSSSAGGPSRYRVLRRHAKGGLGEVFVALDEELQREVALKEIQARHADDPTSRQRFLLEGEVTGRLEHPGIVPVYGLGTHADGRPFYAMRFIKGDSLRHAIDRFHTEASLKADPGKRALELRQLLSRFARGGGVVAAAVGPARQAERVGRASGEPGA